MEQEHEPVDYPASREAWYVVGVLTLAYVFSFIDRQILSLLVKPIQRDLQISDTQLSLLMGTSFAVFYTLFGIPLGRLADTGNRRNLIVIGVAFWSVMTAGCGLARKYWTLALMRMGVGVGEATLSPSAYSMIADCFRPERRSTAMSVYSMGIYIGSGLAFVLGGMVVQFAIKQASFDIPWIGPVRSWQLVFFVVGLPGLPVALLTYLTVREPSRKGLLASAGKGASASMREVLTYVRDNATTFFCLNLGIALVTLNAYGGTAWIPAMYERRFGWTAGQTGIVFGLIVGIAGTCGIVAGGRLADWLNQRGQADGNLRVAWLGTTCWLPFGLLYPLAPSATWAAILLTPALFFLSMPFGVAPAAIQRMMPNLMRAQATALYLFVINLIGMGLGPTVVALLTDHVFEDKNAVHHSLLIVGAVTHILASILLWLGLGSYRRSLHYLESWQSPDASPRGDDDWLRAANRL